MQNSKPKEFAVGIQMTADEYRKQWIRGQVWTHLERPKHIRRLNWCADHCVGAKFADIGCMLGHSTQAMAHRHPGDWTGIDFSQLAIDEARKHFPGIWFLYLDTIPDLMTNGEHYDTAVCSEVIEHVPDPAELLRSLIFIANRVILTTPRADAKDPSHVRLYNEASLLSEIEAVTEGRRQINIETDPDFLYAVIDLKEES